MLGEFSKGMFLCFQDRVDVKMISSS